MSNRITKAILQKRINYLNRITKSPATYFAAGVTHSGCKVTKVNHFCLDSGFGGYKLVRITNELGGEQSFFSYGYVEASKLSPLLNAFIDGIEFQQTRETRDELRKNR